MKHKGLHTFLLGLGLGFSFFTATSHPRSKLYKKLPKKTVRNLSVLPNIVLERKGKTYHFHHWINLAGVYAVVLFNPKLRKKKMLHGILLGGIAQGLLYPDRFRIRKDGTVQPVIDE